MTIPDGSPQLDAYLEQVRRQLRGLPRPEAEETVRELRSHVLDRTSGDLSPASLQPALAALGDPGDLARLNATARVAARGAHSRSPWTIFATIARLARISLGGACALFVSLFGYMIAGAWILAAVVKPFWPGHVGLWRLKDAHDAYAFSLGVVSKAPAAVELLGWWIIPIGLVVGPAVGFCTFLYGRWSLRRLARPRQGRVDERWVAA